MQTQCLVGAIFILTGSTVGLAAPAVPLTDLQITRVTSTYGGAESVSRGALTTSKYHGPSPLRLLVDTAGQACRISTSFSGGTVTETSFTQISGGYRYEFTIVLNSGFASNTQQFTVTANGCTSTYQYSDALTIKFDRNAPTVTILTPTTGTTYVTNKSAFSLSGSASDNDSVTGVTWSGGGRLGTASGTSAWSVTGITLTKSSTTFTISATDISGNVGVDRLTVDYETTQPTISITGPTSADTYFTRNRVLTLAGIANDNYGLKSIQWEAWPLYQTNTRAATKDWTTLPITLALGLNTLRVTAIDKAGNIASDVLQVEYAPLTLAGDYPFEEGSGSLAHDGSGSGNDAILMGGSWSRFGESSALSLNGMNDHASVPGLYGCPQDLTLSAWAQLNAPDAQGAEIISLGDYVGLRLDTRSGKGVSGSYYTGTTWVSTLAGTSFAKTGWHHFVYSIDTTKHTQKLYVDGAEVASTNHTSPIVCTGLGTDTFLGRHGNGSASYDFNGQLDDVRVYRGVMTAQEVSELTRAKGSAAHWRLDEGAGLLAMDSSGNVNGVNGQIIGATWVTGRRESALSFNGLTDYVDLGNPLTLQPSNFSIAVWFKTDAPTGMLVRKRLYGYGLELVSAGSPSFWVYNAAGMRFKVTAPASYNDNQWHHAVGIYDGSNVRLAVDGVLVGTAGAGQVSYGPGGIALGRDGDSGSLYYRGLLDEIRIYNRSLNKQEVLTVFGE